MIKFLLPYLLFLALAAHGQNHRFVDPKIGSVGVGRTFPGPCMPFGMAKPGPDCGVLPNAGWAQMPAPVSGFSQTHVSGTGGGQKYGNILISPFLVGQEPGPQLRTEEHISLGYYSTTFASAIRTEITTSERCSFYRFHYPEAQGGLFIDLTHYLGKDTVPNGRERQQFVGAKLRVVNNHEVRGFSSVRGGWNNGDAYTVYFSLVSDRPFRATVKDGKQLASLLFADSLVNIKMGISYKSEAKAKENIPSFDFDTCLQTLRNSWEEILSKINITGSDRQKRIFYTALYHTMIMPVDKSGENPRWDATPYYDDYYAIWDTYRTSSPLLTLLCPDRERDIVRSLLNIYTHDGYLPDARSGDCNGRTQGGSNAEVVIADAFVKHLDGIDYALALKAMLKDGDQDPGADHEKHGRGGLNEYIKYGYIPYGIPRAGTRTIEYSFDDYCISKVAQGLGNEEVARRYMERSRNWRNLWRSDYEYDGMRGFILPKDEQGRWLDSVVWGQSKVFSPKIAYTPVTKVAPWYLPWWSTFFYEATSEEYSLSVPHDVPALIDLCGGKEAFRQRLDLFFAKGYYNVENEPSFLSPCLYHWIGRPDLSTERIHHIIYNNYTDAPDGLPGNDDSGAMSSWLAFHTLGLYPMAGEDYYLLNVPLVSDCAFSLPNGKMLHITRQGEGTRFLGVTFNGKPLLDARITHDQLMQGGELTFITQPKGQQFTIRYTLNRQYRSWPLSFAWQGEQLIVRCNEAEYYIPRSVVDNADRLSWLSPQKPAVYQNVEGTFAFISKKMRTQLLAQRKAVIDGITWRVTAQTDETLTAKADEDLTEMTVSLTHELPLIIQMKGNPLGIDWKIFEN